MVRWNSIMVSHQHMGCGIGSQCLRGWVRFHYIGDEIRISFINLVATKMRRGGVVCFTAIQE